MFVSPVYRNWRRWKGGVNSRSEIGINPVSLPFAPGLGYSLRPPNYTHFNNDTFCRDINATGILTVILSQAGSFVPKCDEEPGLPGLSHLAKMDVIGEM